MLENYIKFERADESRASPTRGALSTRGRPKAVAWWSSRARPNKIPPYDSLSSFANGIIQWWTLIQPKWRTIKLGTTSRNDGNFKRLYQPGVNGLLNIVVLANWWARILEERESPADESYSWFVSDVTWVISQLIRVAQEDP